MTTPYLFPFNTFLLYRFIGWLVYRFIGWLEEDPKPFFHWNFLDINFLNNENSSYSYHRFHLKEKEGERESVCLEWSLAITGVKASRMFNFRVVP